MSWEHIASAAAVVVGGALVYAKDSKKAKEVDNSVPGINMFVQDLQARLERSENRVDACEKVCNELREELRRRFKED